MNLDNLDTFLSPFGSSPESWLTSGLTQQKNRLFPTLINIGFIFPSGLHWTESSNVSAAWMSPVSPSRRWCVGWQGQVLLLESFPCALRPPPPRPPHLQVYLPQDGEGKGWDLYCLHCLYIFQGHYFTLILHCFNDVCLYPLWHIVIVT